MTGLLLKLFVKDYKNTEDRKVRESYGSLSGLVGIVLNFGLFAAKLLIGTVINSVSVMADSFNNLSDSATSVITLLGFKLAAKPPDSKHPFGHGRTEYMASLMISFFIMFMGYEFFKSSVDKIIHPESVKFSILSVSILALAIFAKIWLARFNNKLGKAIHSKTLLAVSSDSRNDVLVTSSTLASILFTSLTGIIIDGYVGVLVAVILLYTGYGVARDTLSTLMGEAADKGMADAVKAFVLGYEGIVGVHDLVIHNYGPGRSMGSLHAEVPVNVSIEKSHAVIERAEEEVQKKYGIVLVIHMDPVNLADERLAAFSSYVRAFLVERQTGANAHDFRIIEGNGTGNFIFELEVPHKFPKESITQLVKTIKEDVRKMDPKMACTIHVETGYVAWE